MTVEKFNGILLVDKPAGISSFGAVARVRRILTEEKRRMHEKRGFCIESQSAERVSGEESRTKRYDERATKPGDKDMASKAPQSDGSSTAWRCRCKVRVGHAGTLDPFATGLLILLIGKATKQADSFLKLDKTYEATLILGKTSSTADPEGEITEISSKVPTLEEVNAVLQTFTGPINQTPPIFSAIKVNGQRAYKLARKGQEVKLEPRQVKIHEITDVKYTYPELSLTVSVSSGTYIRSLAVDIGEALDTGAYLTALRRTKIAYFDVSQATPVEKVTDRNLILTNIY